KNIVLMILLIVNGALLASVASQELASARYQNQARLGALAVLRDGGIKMDEDALPKEVGLRPRTAERDQGAEQQMAEVLLGTVEQKDEGGRVSYRGAGGEGWFRSNGEFEFLFADGTYPAKGEDPGRHGTELLRRAGMNCVLTDVTDTQEGEQRVTLCQTLDGVPIFSAEIVLTYGDGDLMSIKKQRLTGVPGMGKDTGGKPLDVATVLVRFYGGIRSGGHVCSAVESLTAGYWVSVEPSGISALAPMWRVVTDAGTFYVNGMTGEVSPAGASH
ncbi:MAG: hypothetical protein RR216_06505, partial [Pseudoflavonifractor sp.]